jgi:hypothetical protein
MTNPGSDPRFVENRINVCKEKELSQNDLKRLICSLLRYSFFFFCILKREHIKLYAALSLYEDSVLYYIALYYKAECPEDDNHKPFG